MAERDNVYMSATLVQLASKSCAETEPFAIVEVVQTRGSTPRETGASMVVTAQDIAGTIGGGRLEWDAVTAARSLLAEDKGSQTLSVPLGPEIGQCCGGHVTLAIRRGGAGDVVALERQAARLESERRSVLIYGAGHVGRALARALLPLPFDVSLIDSRPEEFARLGSLDCKTILSDRLTDIAAEAPSGAAHVIMTHSHAQDSLIAAALLDRGDFAYLGLIGSATKKALFLKAFRETGVSEECIARVVCPIGGSTIRDKRPEVIAALTAAEVTTALLGTKDGG